MSVNLEHILHYKAVELLTMKQPLKRIDLSPEMAQFIRKYYGNEHKITSELFGFPYCIIQNATRHMVFSI